MAKTGSQRQQVGDIVDQDIFWGVDQGRPDDASGETAVLDSLLKDVFSLKIRKGELGGGLVTLMCTMRCTPALIAAWISRRVLAIAWSKEIWPRLKRTQ